MNNEMKTININAQDITIKEYLGKRVVTLKDIDTCHGRPEGTASRNFKANRQHFVEGEDFFMVKPSDIQKDEIRLSEINNRGTTLITESGYLMLVKSFTDDLAWDVQRQLVNTYFKVEQKTKKTANPELAKIRADAMMLNAKSRMAKQMTDLWTAAGVEPQYQALALNNYIDGISLPRVAFKEQATALYDATTIAEHLGIMSKSNKPHAQAVGAIIEKLKPLDDSEWAMTPYSRNGHDSESIQYTLSVEQKIAAWLAENSYPATIQGNGKNYTVKYSKTAA